MYIKIYFGNKPVYLCDKIEPELNELLHHPDSIFIDEISQPAIKSLLHEIKKDEFHVGVLCNKDIEKLKKDFFKNFIVVEAAGGIVQNTKKELLFIYRLDKWDLPKGKIDKNETADKTVLREVEEETGVTNMKLKKKVGSTYHAYDSFGKHYLKITHWYYVTCSAEQNLKPQKEENITAVKWIKTENIKEPMLNTYSSIKDIMNSFFNTP